VDLKNEFKISQSHVPVARTSSAAGTGIDFNDCAKHVTAIHAVGAASGDVGAIVKLQESDDNSTFTDITDAAAAELGGTDDNSTQVIQAVRSKRYVRSYITITGSSTPSITSGVALMARKTSY